MHISPDVLDDAKRVSLQSLNEFLVEKQPDFFADDDLVRLAADASAGSAQSEKAETPAIKGRMGLAYLAYFGPRAIHGVASSLALMDDLTLPANAVDIGAGTGAASLLLAKLGVPQLLLADKDANSLHLAERLLASFSPETKVRTLLRDLQSERLPKGEWAVASFSFSELLREDKPESDEELARFSRWIELAQVSERLIIVDAGDKLRSRRLMRLRAHAIEEGLFALAPCLHQEACPALSNERDWCHLRISMNLPAELSEFAHRVGRVQDKSSIGTLVLSKQVRKQNRQQLRVLGAPQKEKGRTRVDVCGQEGVRTLQVPKRHKVTTREVRKMLPGDSSSWPANPDVRDGVLHLQDGSVSDSSATNASAFEVSDVNRADGLLDE
ncbi:MAG: hypothetical protein GY822_25175 [Deltaproteobacteria bacterium]|nr:hypothetical protein [Deltaproteobacteria bacterium]